LAVEDSLALDTEYARHGGAVRPATSAQTNRLKVIVCVRRFDWRLGALAQQARAT